MKKVFKILVFALATLHPKVIFAVLPQSAKLEDVLQDMERSMSSNDFKHVANRLAFLAKHLEKGEASREHERRLVYTASNLVHGITSWIDKRPMSPYGFDMQRMEAINTLNRLATTLDKLDELIPAFSVAKNSIRAFNYRSGGMYGMAGMGMGMTGMEMYGAMPGRTSAMGMGGMPTLPAFGAATSTGAVPTAPAVGGMGMGMGMGMGGAPSIGMGTGFSGKIPMATPTMESFIPGGGMTTQVRIKRRSLTGSFPTQREDSVVAMLDTAKAGFKKLGSIFKGSDRKNNYIAAAKQLSKAIQLANTILRFGDAEKYINARPDVLKISEGTIAKIGEVAKIALSKISVGKVSAPGEISDNDARIEFAKMVAALQGEHGVYERYVYESLKSLQLKTVNDLEVAQRKAEHRARKVIGNGFKAIARMIEYDIPLLIVSAESQLHRQGLEMMAVKITKRIHTKKGPQGELVGSWKLFRDQEVQAIARGIAIGLKRLDLTIMEKGFDDPASYRAAMNAMSALLGRIDLMFEIYTNAKAELKKIWSQLEQLGWRMGKKDGRQKQFFKELSLAYNQGLSRTQDVKTIVAAGKFLAKPGLTPAQLIPAGGIYTGKNDSDAAQRIAAAANYLAWAIVEAGRQANENNRKDEQDRLTAAFQMLGFGTRLTTQVPVFNGVTAMIGNIVKRFRDKLLTIGGLKSSGECYAQLAKTLNLLRGEFDAPPEQKAGLKAGISILFRDLDKKTQDIISKDLSRAKRRAQEEDYTGDDRFVFDVATLSKPPSITSLYGGIVVEKKEEKAKEPKFKMKMKSETEAIASPPNFMPDSASQAIEVK
ncbi:hypothetical protein ACFLY6_02275 [Candidatus Dependentiae bacterium]